MDPRLLDGPPPAPLSFHSRRRHNVADDDDDDVFHERAVRAGCRAIVRNVRDVREISRLFPSSKALCFSFPFSLFLLFRDFSLAAAELVLETGETRGRAISFVSHRRVRLFSRACRSIILHVRDIKRTEGEWSLADGAKGIFYERCAL